MSRKRRDYLKYAHDDCVEWAAWMVRHMGASNIGYPCQTAESCAGQGRSSNKPQASCPELMMPARVSRIDHAVFGMPEDLRRTIYKKYMTGHSVGRHALDAALVWVAAAGKKS